MSVGGVLTFTSAVSNERYLQIQADLASNTTRQSTPTVGEVDLTYQITSTLPSVKYYYFGSQRVAMRQGNEVYYLHGDHLGSTSLTTNVTGTVVAETRHHPFGEVRWQDGVNVTDFGFTGQRNEVGFGLMDYNARYYSPGLGRFVSADIVTPGTDNSQAWNRYTYVFNNPLKHIDPSGHCPPSVDVCRDANGKPIDDYYRYGDRGVIDKLPLSGLNPWFPVDVEAPPYYAPPPSPDGISVQIAISPAKAVPAGVGTVGAFEVLYNYHTGDRTLFGIAGFEGHLGIGSTLGPVKISEVYNIEDDNLNYGENFRSIDFTGAYVFGLDIGYSWVPDPRTPNPAYSYSVGPVAGMGGSIEGSQTEYIPLFTLHSDGSITPHASEYLNNPETNGFITNYYRQLNEVLQPFIEE